MLSQILRTNRLNLNHTTKLRSLSSYWKKQIKQIWNFAPKYSIVLHTNNIYYSTSGISIRLLKLNTIIYICHAKLKPCIYIIPRYHSSWNDFFLIVSLVIVESHGYKLFLYPVLKHQTVSNKKIVASLTCFYRFYNL